MREAHPLIAREGWAHLAIAGGASILATIFWGWWSLPFWAATVFVLQFFRDPQRTPPTDANVALSPADGRVLVVERTQDPYLKRESLKISVFMNVFNVHSNRSPVDGQVAESWYHAGEYLNAALDKASERNERMALHLRTDRGQDVTCVQIAGLVARRILCYAKPQDRLTRAQRYGFIRFGSRVDLYLPPASRPRVSVGDTVYAGLTIVAELPV